jgi:transposase
MTGKYLTSFQRKLLQKNIEDSEQDLSEQLRKRIQIMLYADEGKSQTEICQELKCSAATARTWILKAQSGMAHQWKEHPLGRPRIIQKEHVTRLQELVNLDPRELGEHFTEWTGYSLSRRLEKEFGIQVSKHHVNRLLKQSDLDAKESLSKSKDRKERSRISICNLPVDCSSELS